MDGCTHIRRDGQTDRRKDERMEGCARTYVLMQRSYCTPAGRSILFRLKTHGIRGTVESNIEYILEQSVSLRAVPGLIVGAAVELLKVWQSLVPVSHTSGHTMLKCISKQSLIKIYHEVQRVMSIFTN